MATTSSVAMKSSFLGAVNVSSPSQVSVKAGSFTCRAEKTEDSAAVSRRASLALLAGASLLTLRASPAEAAYGEAANVFGKSGNTTGFNPYTGDGFSLSIPAKWNPSNEREFPGTVLRYEDNFDATNNFSVIIQKSDKKNITDYGTPEQFLEEVSYLLGQQSYFGKTASEGGFAPNAVATAAVLDAGSVNVSGKDYYKLSVLTRTADGDEGGKHQLITAAVSDGKLYIFKIQAGDKRWFKGAKKFVEGADSSFIVA